MTARTVHHHPMTIAAACAAPAGADPGLVYGGGTAVQIMIKHGMPAVAARRRGTEMGTQP
jgi:hypothetical protein